MARESRAAKAANRIGLGGDEYDPEFGPLYTLLDSMLRAMAKGRIASFSAGGPGLARVVNRTPAGDYEWSIRIRYGETRAARRRAERKDRKARKARNAAKKHKAGTRAGRA